MWWVFGIALGVICLAGFGCWVELRRIERGERQLKRDLAELQVRQDAEDDLLRRARDGDADAQREVAAMLARLEADIAALEKERR